MTSRWSSRQHSKLAAVCTLVGIRDRETYWYRQGVLIRHGTTDGDSRSSAGIDSALKVLDPLWHVQHLADPTHLGRSVSKMLQNQLQCRYVLWFNS